MPIYEYICRSCSHKFERKESIHDKPNKKCPKCDKMDAERQISGGQALVFKGSGFYCNDYGSDKKSE